MNAMGVTKSKKNKIYKIWTSRFLKKFCKNIFK